MVFAEEASDDSCSLKAGGAASALGGTRASPAIDKGSFFSPAAICVIASARRLMRSIGSAVRGAAGAGRKAISALLGKIADRAFHRRPIPGDPGEVAAAIVRRAKETKTTYHK